jgi:hypothetical protein
MRILLGVALSAALGLMVVHAAEAKGDKLTTKEIMKKAHKGDNALVKKVQKGEASKEEIKQLLDWYKIMATEEPPKGELASWKEKCAALVSATEKLSKDASALPEFKKAVSCKSCHMAHKPD